MRIFSLVTLFLGFLALAHSGEKPISKNKNIELVEIIYRAYCDAQEEFESQLKGGPTKVKINNIDLDPSDSSPQAHLKYIADLSVERHSFANEEDKTRFYKDLSQRRSKFKQLIWDALKKRNHRHAEVMKRLKTISKNFAAHENFLARALHAN